MSIGTREIGLILLLLKAFSCILTPDLIEQLKIGPELELWQEAFRSIENIHRLMCVLNKTPKPSLMVVYYSKLSEVFWMSSSHLYHAYAWLKEKL
ncbi:hypothetical protein CDL12_09574 [Handroanthus impetiginosus]|uniref:eIF3a PCI domain-containing protein n=1 Tax=Handroanthus impetiginosus TaxID=429701 RepID=A0A2G9HJS6_9LAMI|nr:hypothetical protein CDL12_09574 [Handroanthus impetiginosus]